MILELIRTHLSALDVLPDPTRHDLVDTRRLDSVFSREINSGFQMRFGSNSADIILAKARFRVVSAVHSPQANSDGVSDVFLMGDNFKIFQRIIRLFPILVVHGHFPGHSTKEGVSYERVNLSQFPLSILGKVSSWVSANDSTRQDSSSNWLDSSPAAYLSSRNGSNSPLAGNFIEPFVADDWTPLFNCFHRTKAYA